MKIRKAFVISVNPGSEEEYERRHRPIWPELEKVLKDHGVSNYSIFLHPETHQLFGYAEIACWVKRARIERRERPSSGGGGRFLLRSGNLYPTR